MAEIHSDLLTLTIKNINVFDWDDITVSINDKFQQHIEFLGSGQMKKLLLSEFSRNDGLRFNIQVMKIRRASISCNQGFSQYEFKY